MIRSRMVIGKEEGGALPISNKVGFQGKVTFKPSLALVEVHGLNDEDPIFKDAHEESNLHKCSNIHILFSNCWSKLTDKAAFSFISRE